MTEGPESKILNVQSNNEIAEITIVEDYQLQGSTGIKLDHFNQKVAILMEDEGLQQEDEDELSNTGMMSVRKATILHAESVLAKNMGSSGALDKCA